MNSLIQRYELSGGSVVTVYKPFGSLVYLAVVEMVEGSVYPEMGKTARNSKRQEFSVVISGAFVYTVNGVSYPMEVGDTQLVGDGDSYRIKGKGKVVVLVADEEGGTTIVE